MALLDTVLSCALLNKDIWIHFDVEQIDVLLEYFGYFVMTSLGFL